MRGKRKFCVAVISIICISMLMLCLPQRAQAEIISGTDNNGGNYTIIIGEGSTVIGWEYSGSWDNSGGGLEGGTGAQGGNGSNGKSYQRDMASAIEKIIGICQKYDDRTDTTGVRNQINWMKELYRAATQDFARQLGLGDTLLLAVLNHSDINSALMTSSYSTGDINREVAKRITEGAEGYVSVDAIAKATGLKAKDVRSILERIAAGGITEKTIAVGKNRTRASSRGVYVNHQALKQDKVWKYLVTEVERMSGDPDSLEILYEDLGAGYVENMLSGQKLDKYMVSLYKKELADILDNVLNSDNPISVATITKSDPYKVTNKVQSALNKLYKYEMAVAEDNLDESLSEELVAFLKKHKGNGIFTESEAREYLILSGQYEAGEHGITDAAKLLSNSHKYMKGFESAMKATGKVFSAAEEAKKMENLIGYIVKDYGKQEILLEELIGNLSESGADMELLAAARELKQDYENKLSGTLDKVYDALIDKGIGTVKSAFPPLGITEACISLAGTVTGGSDIASALETGFAMQGICKQALEDYENAVIAVNNGDTSDEAVSKVLTTFETARQSLISYYEAMVTLAETKEQEKIYSEELKKLEKATFGYIAEPSPIG